MLWMPAKEDKDIVSSDQTALWRFFWWPKKNLEQVTGSSSLDAPYWTGVGVNEASMIKILVYSHTHFYHLTASQLWSIRVMNFRWLFSINTSFSVPLITPSTCCNLPMVEMTPVSLNCLATTEKCKVLSLWYSWISIIFSNISCC